MAVERRRQPVVTVALQMKVVHMLVFATCSAAQGGAPIESQIIGAGASFPLQVYERWVAMVRSRNTEYSYEAVGSGTGKQRLLSGAIDFAGSDSKLSAEQESECPGCWFVPSLAGAVAKGYNVPGLKAALRVPREVLALIFRGDVRLWSELSEWNPALADTTERIRLCVRADKSGTTEVLTSALSSFSSAFAEKPDISSLPEWPVSDGRSVGTAALARRILISDFSMGYLSLADAREWGVPTAMISNAEGEFVAPTVVSGAGCNGCRCTATTAAAGEELEPADVYVDH